MHYRVRGHEGDFVCWREDTWKTSEATDYVNMEERRKRTHGLLRDMKLAGSSGLACTAANFRFGTHTKAQSCAGLSVPGVKDQGTLAGMHVPTAGVVWPAQRRVIGIKGAWQCTLSRRRHGTSSTNRHQRRPCNAPNKFEQKRQRKCWHTCSEWGILKTVG